ncbi:hypothetical protein BHF68_02420 [Desulfuribacillus alkaliarsenatis]|uniref:non-specific serine/threonine protein kinase n=2 Tax=Desulfuribacillus alkaliarsenatis TaxID=766136 RepID=A0A1E5G6H0_9FIRM|nr:hypothetical protein BHF68_02420 [Desulfuribacillus alkaliarsenatis]
MAVVYKATDNILNRTVAIKLLRQEFCHDPEFVKNFENEAQAAASLSHPNVVNIFDVGKDGDDHFIVMEYIDGRTLKEVIQERAPLPSAEVIEIAKQICDALEHAHQNQIIHRDIKPHNILINKFGSIKVTDFGIARAVTSSTITYQADTVLGSVHYFSPEQARGGVASATSDIYSLGVVMYEMLTGKLPFSGESPISIALKHLQDELTEPSIYNQEIPSNLENIVLRALAKNPLHRYKSANQMLRDLKVALNRNFQIHRFRESDEQGQPTRVIPIIKDQDTPMRAKQDSKDIQKQVDVDEEETRSLIDHPAFKAGVAIFFIVLISTISFYLYKSFVEILYVPETTMPAVEGELLSDAIVEIREAGFNVENIIEEPRYDLLVPEGQIIRQDPSANSRLKINFSPIVLYVSLGKEPAEMPDLVGMTVSRAKQLLEQRNFEVTIEERFNENVPEGQVYDQMPRSYVEVFPDETEVILYVSKGLEAFSMPNLVGQSLNEAERVLQEHQLVRGTIHQESSYVVQKGEVTRQAPFAEGNEVTRGEIIDIWISSGYPNEARFYEEAIFVQPTQPGQNTDVIIKVNDARGRDQIFYERTIADEELFTVQIVLAPNTIGVIEVYLNGVFVDSKAVSY